MAAPLEGLRVVDFTRVLAGPLCTKTLRDLGADVIKIEPPAGDAARFALPAPGDVSVYFTQQNAGKRNLSVDLNWPEARELVTELCRRADVIVENFRPGTLARFGLAHADVARINPGVVYVSLSGYGQTGPWRNRPAYAVTVHAETGLTDLVRQHFADSDAQPHNDACSHGDVYTGLQGVIAVLAALRHRDRTGEGQFVDVSMAATMLAVNERAGAQLSGIDMEGELPAFGAAESPIFELPDGRQVTIVSSPVGTMGFRSYCAVMRRNDLLLHPDYLTAELRRRNLPALLSEIRSWILTFKDLDLLQAQVSEASMAIGVVRTTQELAASEWTEDWGAVRQVDDRAGGTVAMPGTPWRFSGCALPDPGKPMFQGENNTEVLRELGLSPEAIAALAERGVLLRRGGPADAHNPS